jgi:hypothetical protein
MVTPITHRFGHKVADAKIFAEEGADLCAADIVADLLHGATLAHSSNQRKIVLEVSHLVYDVDVVSPLGLEFGHGVVEVGACALDDKCADYTKMRVSYEALP